MVLKTETKTDIYQCEICKKSYRTEAEASVCENQQYHRKYPLYGDWWLVGDKMVLFGKRNGYEYVEVHTIEKEYIDGHEILPYPPEVRQGFGHFEFLATIKKADFQ